MIEYILGSITIICIYSTVNMMRKVEHLEGIIDEQDNEYFSIKQKVRDAIIEMKQIDSKGGFESDDEVGSIFNGLKEVVEELGENIDEA
jgi:hypothetical protein